MSTPWRKVYRSAQLAFVATLLAACGGNDDIVDTVGDNACLQYSSTGAVYNPGTPGENGAPEIATGFASKKTAYARSYMVVANNPLATKAGCDVLRAGGSAVDAAVAVQMVLNLVEPQSSGIGGGAFMLYFDRAKGTVTAYDGRETAPAAATENYLRWISDANKTTPLPNARASGRSIGTPGVLAMLDLAHKDGGKLTWKELFDPAIKLANEGFKISPRMNASVAASATSLVRDPDARAYFLNADNTAKATGTVLKSPALASTFTAIANGGAAAFYSGAIAQDMVDKIADTSGGITGGATTLADLSAYKAKKREAICTVYRIWWVCGMPPPSSGGLAVAQTLGILETFDLSLHKPTAIDINGGKPSANGVHLVSEAERLAYADRDKYVADVDFVPLPGGSPARMIDKTYLRQRAGLINLQKSMGTALPGDLGPVPLGISGATGENGTTHISIADGRGNVVSMTTTVESAFGSFHMAKGGFLLNNQLTDFSAAPTDAAGVPIANRVAAGKRPRSSMAPTLVFRSRSTDGGIGEFRMATGSPGGATIIQYVAKTLVGVIDWGLDAQQATSMIDFGASNNPATNVGSEHPNVDLTTVGGVVGANDALITGLRALGHTVNTAQQSSGIATIVRRSNSQGYYYYEGGADPRREGTVLGDLYPD